VARESSRYFLIENAVPEAFADYEKGLSVRQKLSDTDQNNARWSRDLFYTLNRMVTSCGIIGDDKQAEAYRSRALQVWERVRPLFPTDRVLAQTAAALVNGRG
jgi:hypothetical protein